jgi:hypothetical protein
VQLDFEIDGVPATFRRSYWTGRGELSVRGEAETLQSPYRFWTHFHLRNRVAWRRRVNGHEVDIVKVRPRILGGWRANRFTVSVDNTVVADRVGR